MKASIVTFPGSNCDRDIRVAMEGCGVDITMVWHNDSELPASDLVVVPGGFSYGDYLRCGAIAAHSPIMKEVVAHAEKGGYVLGICNGFQILTEIGLLPGVLMRNNNLKFICKDVNLRVENGNTVFTGGFDGKNPVRIPIAHHDGNYRVDDDTFKELEDSGQIAFRYANDNGDVDSDANPNGSVGNIAGVFNRDKNILGMMPHPERLWEDALGGTDGRLLFDSLVAGVK